MTPPIENKSSKEKVGLWRRIGGLFVKKGTFTGDALVSMAGTGAGRLIALASMPFVTRLYDADDYGIWVILLAFGGILQPFATLRYELAMVLAPTRRMAGGLALAILALAGVSAIIVFLAAGCLPSWMIERVSGLTRERQGILLIAPVVLLVLVGRVVLEAWATRQRDFVGLALSQLALSTVTAAAMLSFPFIFGASAKTVSAAAITGFLACLGVLAWRSASLFSSFGQRWKTVAAWRGLRRYKVYAIYMLPYSLSALLADRVIQLVLASGYSLATLGTYFFARQLMTAPANVLGNAMRQVWFGRGARDGIDSLRSQLERYASFVLMLVAPVLAFGIVWLVPMISRLFGDKWPALPVMSWWMMFLGCVLLLTNGLDRIFDVMGRQRLAVFLQITIDVITTLIFLCMVYYKFDDVSVIGAIAVSQSLFRMVWFVVVLHIARITYVRIMQMFVSFIVIFTITLFAQYLAHYMMHQVTGVIFGSVILIISIVLTFAMSAKPVRILSGKSLSL